MKFVVLSNNVFVKYCSHRTLSVSFVRVVINKWDLGSTYAAQNARNSVSEQRTATTSYAR